MDICDKLIDLRITLSACCDGFSLENSTKGILLSARTKMLYLLNDKDMTPGELISSIGIAKSNLANLSKLMSNDGVIESYKTAGNYRNVYYRITSLGREELAKYKGLLAKLVCFDDSKSTQLGIYIDKILELIKGGQHD